MTRKSIRIRNILQSR